MEQIKLDLNKTQLSKLQRGMGVQLSPEIVGEGMPMKLTKAKVLKMLKAKSKGKGSRLSMTDAEMEGSGMTKKPRRKRVPKKMELMETSEDEMEGYGVKKQTRKRVPKVIEMMKPMDHLVRTQRYSTSMVDNVLPASRPLISLSTAAYGDLFIKG